MFYNCHIHTFKDSDVPPEISSAGTGKNSCDEERVQDFFKDTEQSESIFG